MYLEDDEFINSMNMEFDGEVSFTYGEFWHSKKGSACFRPQDPMKAKHLLISISWGGCFNKTRGIFEFYAKENGALYFRSSSSNGRGLGHNYMVFPVGYKRSLYDPEFDGETEVSESNLMENIFEFRKKHSDFQKQVVSKAEKILQEKYAAEEKSRNLKESFIDRLKNLQGRIDVINNFSKEDSIGKFSLELSEEYFFFGCYKYLYTEEKVRNLEEEVLYLEEKAAAKKARNLANAKMKAEFQPKFAELESRFFSLNLEMLFDSDRVDIKDGDHTVMSFRYDSIDFLLCYQKLEERERQFRKEQEQLQFARALHQAEKNAKELGLPGNIRIWRRDGATNAGQGFIIMPNGMDRPCDEIECPRPRYTSEGYEIWNQILPGELVLEWKHSFTAAEHEFNVIYRPNNITESQLERVAEIQEGIEKEYFGQKSLTGNKTCPSIGQGWGLFQRDSSLPSSSSLSSGFSFGEVLSSLVKK